MTQKYRVIGLMSGTSLDGIDVALLETDGQGYVQPMGGETFAYDPLFRDQLRRCLGNKNGRADPHVAWSEQELTKYHGRAVLSFLSHQGLSAKDVDFLGFHGQTIWHNPALKQTIQLGDASLLADMTKIDVVHDFRTADVLAGGQGAPLVPLYHRALVRDLPKPLAVLNIGGVANVTWIGGEGDDEILAFDTGPGNALLDDWVNAKTGQLFDRDGVLAAQGKVDHAHMRLFSHHPFFDVAAPKSLDRDAFMNFVPRNLSDADGAATLTMMTAYAVALGLEYVPHKPLAFYIAGGGRHNPVMTRWVAEQTEVPVRNVDELGWNGDLLEAEAFAYLAVRSVLGLPLTLPKTTGASQPLTGGALCRQN